MARHKNNYKLENKASFYSDVSLYGAFMAYVFWNAYRLLPNA